MNFVWLKICDTGVVKYTTNLPIYFHKLLSEREASYIFKLNHSMF